MKRIHVPNMGPDTNNVTRALAIGVAQCRNAEETTLAIITPVKDNLDSIVVGEVLGQDASKCLMKGDAVPINNLGVSLKHFSVSTVQRSRAPKIAVAFYVSSKSITKLDDLAFECLVYVPWLDKDGTSWAARWGAETSDGETPGSSIDLPQEVETALSGLTTCVNLSTGLSHPSDMKHAKRKFSNLRSAGVQWNPAEVEKWAVRHGWQAGDAAELAKLSGKYT